MFFFKLWQYWTEKILWNKFFCCRTASLGGSGLTNVGFLEGDAGPAPLGDLKSFENEWLEVEVKHSPSWSVSSSSSVGAAPGNTAHSVSPASPLSTQSSVDNTTLPKFLQDNLEELCQEDGSE